MTALHPRIVSCKVISLEDSERIDGFFQRPGSEHFEIVRATDGRKGEGEELFDREAFFARYGREVKAAEIGCAVSHFRTLSEFAASAGDDTDLVLIAEDDARLSPRAVRVMNSIASRVNDIDMAILAGVTGSVDRTHVLDLEQVMGQLSLGSRIIGWSGSTFYRFGLVEGDARCAGLYISSRRAARRYVKLVEVSGGLSWFADEFEIIVGRAGGNLQVLRPDIAFWEGRSTLGSGVAKPFNLSDQNWTLSQRLRGAIALRTRVKRLRGSAAAGLRQLADEITPHPRRFEGREALMADRRRGTAEDRARGNVDS